MKFLVGRSLKQIGLYSLPLMIVILLGNISRTISNPFIEGPNVKLILLQYSNWYPAVALQSTLFAGNTHLARKYLRKLSSKISLGVLADGGRIDGTAFFIEPLSFASNNICLFDS
jgi:hypothetical protein